MQSESKSTVATDPIRHFTPDDHRYFEARAIDLTYAYTCGVRRLGHEELHDMGFRGPKGATLAGIVFPTVNPKTKAETAGIWRPDAEVGCDAKYLRSKDHGGSARNRTCYFSPVPKTKNPEIFLCESPAKAIALQQAFDEERFNGYCVGLNGVNGGWFRLKEMVPDAKTGGLREKRGYARLVEDLAEIDWNKRRVTIVFDNDVNTHKHAERWKKHEGVLWAEAKLSELLRARGASVMMANLPYRGEKMGIDDFIARYGSTKSVDFLKHQSITHRNPAAILLAPEGGKLSPNVAKSLYGKQRALPDELVAPRLIERKCVYLLSAPAKFGKSLLATNLIAALETGKPFLGAFHVKQQVRSMYVSYEMPEYAIAERFESVGIMESLYLDAMDLVDPTTGEFKEWCLNPVRGAGYGKTVAVQENQGHLRELERMIVENKLGLVVVDPLIDAIDTTPNDEVVARTTIQHFRAIARRCNCAILIVHHTRKRLNGNGGGSTGEDESAGSSNWVRKVDGAIVGEKRSEAGLYRHRLHFTLRYSEIEDQELYRGKFKEGDYTMYVEQWKQGSKEGSVWESRERELFDEFGGQEINVRHIRKHLELSDVQTSKLLKRVISRGGGKKVKNGWYILSQDIDSKGD